MLGALKSRNSLISQYFVLIFAWGYSGEYLYVWSFSALWNLSLQCISSIGNWFCFRGQWLHLVCLWHIFQTLGISTLRCPALGTTDVGVRLPSRLDFLQSDTKLLKPPQSSAVSQIHLYCCWRRSFRVTYSWLLVKMQVVLMNLNVTPEGEKKIRELVDC